MNGTHYDVIIVAVQWLPKVEIVIHILRAIIIQSASKSCRWKIISYRINAFEEKIVALLAWIAEVRVWRLLVELCPAEVAEVGLKMHVQDIICMPTICILKRYHSTFKSIT